MAENKMAEVVKLLRVEFGEKFKIKFNTETELSKDVYWFEESSGLINDRTRMEQNDLLFGVLSGYFKIVKLPWKPKNGESYYTFYSNGDNIIISSTFWANDIRDKVFYRLGFVHKTKEDAEANLPRAEKFFRCDDVINWERAVK